MIFGDMPSAHDFLTLFVLSAVLASVVGCFFPAHAGMLYYASVRHSLRHIVPGYCVAFARLLDDLRSNPRHVLELANLPGLTTFPSFHTAMGTIAIYCARKRIFLFIPTVLFNGLMIASTPVFGAHYFVDLIAGASLALALIVGIRVPYRNIWAHISRQRPPSAPGIATVQF
jgi:membrane-associated phospholipid phosphatase